MESQVKIYKNVVCLEMPSSNGPKWWYQGYNLAFSPMPANWLKQLTQGTLKGSRKKVFTTAMDFNGKVQNVAVNMQRSDVWALINLGLVPRDTLLPRSTPNYSPNPEKI